MTVWEYEVIQGFSLGGTMTRDNLKEKLNELGEDGWELVTRIPSPSEEEPLIVFKRPMVTKPKM